MHNPTVKRRRHFVTIRAFLALGLLLATIRRGEAQVQEIFRCLTNQKDVSPCSVCLVPYSFGKAHLCTPDRVTLSIPPGRYEFRAWSKSKNLVLARNTSLTVQPDDTNRDGKPYVTLIDLASSGTVVVKPGTIPSTGAAQVLSLATGRVDTLFIEREHEIPFPVGATIAMGIKGRNQLLGVTRPFEITMGATKVIDGFGRAPKGRGDLLIRFDFQEDRPLEVKQDVELTLTQGATAIKPNAATNLPKDAHYSFFYGLPAGRYSVSVASKFWRIAPAFVDVKSEEFIIADQIPILFKPNLQVEIHDLAPPGEGPYRIALYECKQLGPGTALWPDLKSCSAVRTVAVSREATFSGLDPRWYFVLAEVGKRKAGAHVDLREGLNRKEQITFRRTHVHGLVVRGGTALVADLRFQNVDDLESTFVRSGADGSFEADLFTAGVYKVGVAPPASPPEREAKFDIDLQAMPEDLKRDFELPRADVGLKVLDERSRQPIDGASVSFVVGGNGQILTTDSLGEVSLPPVPAGSFSCSAEAKGHRPERATLRIADVDGLQKFEILLKPLRDDLSFRVVSASGGAVASPMLFGRFDGTKFLLIQPCDGDGLCRFSDQPGPDETMFLAQKDAGLTVFNVGTALDQGSVTMRNPGGRLRIPVRRGPQTAGAMLEIEVSLTGTYVPLQGLVMVSSIAQAMDARPILQSGGEDVFVLAGLPVGTVTCHISQLSTTGTPATPVVEPFSVGLPQQQTSTVSLP